MQRELYDPTKPFNEQIRKLIQDTHPKDGPIILRPHGKRFSIHEDSNYWKDYDKQEATDGIGEVRQGSGRVFLESQFDGKIIEYK